MQPPTIADLLRAPVVRQAIEEAWVDSEDSNPSRRHEEGGWVYADVIAGGLTIRRAPAGGHAMLDLNTPPLVVGSMIVATFYTHPNPTAEGWDPQPSPADTRSAEILGVPCIVRADNGIYTTGPDSRRGGLLGNSGFPA
jgi:hypothetical protein